MQSLSSRFPEGEVWLVGHQIAQRPKEQRMVVAQQDTDRHLDL